MMLKSPLLAMAGLLALTACDTAREQFDLSKKAPDEFAVVRRAPLEIPKEFNLPEPRPGAERPQEIAPVKEAAQTVLGESVMVTEAPALGAEAALLQKVNASQAAPDIRRIVDGEVGKALEQEKPVVDKLLGLVSDKSSASSSIVDAPKEAERIRENLEAGRPITAGETPVIEN